jgi:FG-GAP-like repeat
MNSNSQNPFLSTRNTRLAQSVPTLLRAAAVGILATLVGCAVPIGEYDDGEDEVGEAQSAILSSVSLWSPSYANSAGLPDSDLLSVRFADIDGDGRDDLCGIQTGPVITGVYCTGAPSTVSPASFHGWNNTPGVSHWDLTQPKYRKTLAFPDVNNDGRADVCIRQSDGIHCAVASKLPPSGSCAAKPCPIFVNEGLWSSWFADDGIWDSDPSYYETIQYPDLNNDGSADVCGRDAGGIRCALSNGGNTFSAPILMAPFFGNQNGWNADPSYWSTIRFVDVSGDGFADVCGRSSLGIYCGLFDPLNTTFKAPRLRDGGLFSNPSWAAPEHYETIEYGDLDGDRAMDVCGRGVSGMHCGLSTGPWLPDWSVEFSMSYTADLPQFSNANGWDSEARYSSIRMVDATGDGRADVCGSGSAGIFCAPSKSTVSGVAFNTWELMVDNLGEADGWHGHETHYLTIQPALVSDISPSGVGFCGRGVAGIYCSE